MSLQQKATIEKESYVLSKRIALSAGLWAYNFVTGAERPELSLEAIRLTDVQIGGRQYEVEFTEFGTRIPTVVKIMIVEDPERRNDPRWGAGNIFVASAVHPEIYAYFKVEWEGGKPEDLKIRWPDEHYAQWAEELHRSIKARAK